MMAKNTDYCFTDTDRGSAGTMICSTCGELIEDSKYLEYKKWKNGDWGYVTHHLSCALLNDHFAVMYAKHIKKETDERIKRELESAKEKREAVKLVNSSSCDEIEDGEEYDCYKIILIHKD